MPEPPSGTAVFSVSLFVGGITAAPEALERAPGPNVFGLLIVGLLVVAAGVAVWASLRDLRARGNGWGAGSTPTSSAAGGLGPCSASDRSASPPGLQGRRRPERPPP